MRITSMVLTTVMFSLLQEGVVAEAAGDHTAAEANYRAAIDAFTDAVAAEEVPHGAWAIAGQAVGRLIPLYADMGEFEVAESIVWSAFDRDEAGGTDAARLYMDDEVEAEEPTEGVCN